MPDSIFQTLNQHIPVSRETYDKLSIYHDLLIKWQKRINLVSNESIDTAWHRHFLDSLQLIKYIPDLSSTMLDMGTGAGFPGMTLAIYGARDMHLIESDAKKITFLREVARLTDTRVTFHNTRIESIKNLTAKIILSRACSELKSLCKYAHLFVSHETTCLFHKGKNYSKEIEDASKIWSFAHTIFPSVTSDQGVILQLSNLREREP